jgi:threonylcarbamoyladenosine tRNA methylthiotransferase MtaB
MSSPTHSTAGCEPGTCIVANAVLLKSIGCRTNQEEMASLGSLLARQGNRIVDKLEDADVVVVNSCFVTSSAEAKTRRLIQAISRARPQAKICVTGCLAQHSPLETKRRLPATWVVGNTLKDKIPGILADGSGGVFHEDFGAAPGGRLVLADAGPCSAFSGRTRFFLKIQEGCGFRCSYCVVPFVRGPSTSAPFAQVKAACAAAVKAGFKEIVLTGTHIGQYQDGQQTTLTDLVAALAGADGDLRIRLSSLDPRDLSDRLLEMVATHPKLCRHLHVSVQSLSAAVLKAMNRPFSDLDGFIHRLSAFRTRYPRVGLGGDFIVGFPSETGEHFDDTCAAVSAVGFSYGHVFRYSRRPGTAAASLSGQVDGTEKNGRSARLRTILDKCNKAFIEGEKGSVHTLLVENEEPASGLASNYLRMEVPGCAAPKNTWLDVVITGIDPGSGRCVAAAAKGGARAV